MSVQKSLKDSMAALTREVSLAASYGELSKSLQRRVELVTRFFLAFGEEVDALSTNEPMKSSMAALEMSGMVANGDTSIFDMGRG